jgi:hypothetical protein
MLPDRFGLAQGPLKFVERKFRNWHELEFPIVKYETEFQPQWVAAG